LGDGLQGGHTVDIIYYLFNRLEGCTLDSHTPEIPDMPSFAPDKKYSKKENIVARKLGYLLISILIIIILSVLYIVYMPG
jgi:hypothetical protein